MSDRLDRLDQLLNDINASDPEGRARYRAALDADLAALEPRSVKKRYVAVGLAGLIGCLVCGSLSLSEPPSTPMPVRWLLMLLALIGLGWTLLASWVLCRRAGNFAADRLAAARSSFGFALIAILGLSLTASALNKGAAGVPLFTTGLAFLILGAVNLIVVRIDHAEQALRERILRLECRLEGFSRDRRPS